MEGSEFNEQKEQEEWIAKYRAALDAVSKRQPHSQGLSAIVQGVTAHFQTVFRTARDKLGKSNKVPEPSLEPIKNKDEVATSTLEPPGEEVQAKKEGVLVEETAPAETECQKAS
jgi:hypothetical protein